MNKKIIYFISFSLLFLMSCKYAEPIDYIIENKKEGYYAIVYDCKNGINKNYENGRLQYVFPNNKIIITSYPKKFGIVDQRFFYYDEKGKKKEFFPSYHENADENFLAFGPTQVSTITYERTILYFGEDSHKRTNENFIKFSQYVDYYIKKKGLKCGKDR